MKTTAQFSAMIQQGLDTFHYPAAAPNLYAPVRYALSTGGKRLRPTLVLMAASLYTENVSPALPAALGIEIYHNYTLLHDDVLDHAAERRGRPSVWAKWGADQAILSGDVMVGLAFRQLAESPVAVLPDVLRTFNTLHQEIHQGQQYDMEFEERNDVTIEEYMEMIRLKTSVLLGRALQIGAYIGQSEATGGQRTAAHDDDIDTLWRFGNALGLAFQLQDDWLDCWGDPKTFGKRIGGDILEDKKTFLRLTAQQRSAEPLTQGMSELDKIAAYKAYYVSTGAEQACQEAISHYTQLATESLSALHVAPEKLQLLTDLTRGLEKRKI